MALRFPFPFPAGDFTPPVVPGSGLALSPDVLVSRVRGPVGFGQDIDHLLGVDPNLGLLGGSSNLGQALLHRLQTPRGGLFYDLNYGTDLRLYVNDAMTSAKASRVAADAQAECAKDERVVSCTATATFNQAAGSLTLRLNCSTASGPFTFIVSVTSVSVKLLESPARA